MASMVVNIQANACKDWTNRLHQWLSAGLREFLNRMWRLSSLASLNTRTAVRSVPMSLKEKMESFWPKILSHWWNKNSTQDTELLQNIWVKLTQIFSNYSESWVEFWFHKRLKFLGQNDSILRIFESIWLKYYPITRNLGSNLSSSSVSTF